MKTIAKISSIFCIAACLAVSGCTKLFNPSFAVTVTDITSTSATVNFFVDDFNELKQLVVGVSPVLDGPADSTGTGPVAISGASFSSSAVFNGFDPDIDHISQIYDKLAPGTKYCVKATAKIGWAVAKKEVEFTTEAE